MRATEILEREHEVILKVLDCLERLAAGARGHEGLDRASAEQALDFFRSFADRCHHAKEEDRLFPALVAKGMPKDAGPIAVMLSEHEQGREAVACMRRAVAGAEADTPGAAQRFAQYAETYVALLREHIRKENQVLFPMADRILAEGDQARLLREFEQAELDLEGTGERCLNLAHALCARWGVAWEIEPTVI
jgi:hemerythrin-like domain-containing protein